MRSGACFLWGLASFVFCLLGPNLLSGQELLQPGLYINGVYLGDALEGLDEESKEKLRIKALKHGKRDGVLRSTSVSSGPMMIGDVLGMDGFSRQWPNRKTIAQEEGFGPSLKFYPIELSLPMLEAEAIERQELLIHTLAAQIEEADSGAKKASLMDDMADVLLKRAQIFECRAADSLKLASQTLKPAEVKRHQAKAVEEKRIARKAREEIRKLHRDIFAHHSDFEGIDKVRYDMAFNLDLLGHASEAYEQYSEIAAHQLSSKYLPEAHLGMAEHHFNGENIALAIQQYQKVLNVSSQSRLALFANYKMTWCYLRLGEASKAFELFESVIRTVDKSKFASDWRQDLVKAYSMHVETDVKAAGLYFASIAKDDAELNAMMKRLARLYQETERIEASSAIYQQLLTASRGPFESLNYQYEIMRNAERQANSTRWVEEMQRSALLLLKARDGKFEHADRARVAEMFSELESYMLDAAKWFLKTYKVTNNPLYDALLFKIYKSYIDYFPGAVAKRESMLSYANMLYFRGHYADAAKVYEEVIDSDDEGKYIKKTAYRAVLAYEKSIKLSRQAAKEICPVISEAPLKENGHGPIYSALPIADCWLKLVEACKRYIGLDATSQDATYVKILLAQMYFNTNRYVEARALFFEVLERYPEKRDAVRSAEYILEIDRRLLEYEKMFKAIASMKANPVFMGNSS